ncbi:dihydrofolate reductase family protein [Puia sp.]|jgi:dihydrofolate reductase|uniref:dihydrofolate reductase family protein n=1 Tax=Puia sp. TaxID=2045100 RepID=UPI002F3EA94A
MRKVKLQVQLSLDGFMATPDHKMDFLEWNWDEKLKKYVGDLTGSSDTMILGTVLYQGMAAHWPAIKPDNEMYAAAQGFNAMKKVVFSSALKGQPLEWNNSELAAGDAASVIRDLKSKPGKDIIAYGGERFVRSLLKEDLIDEYHLFVNPAAIGKGLTIFGGLERYKKFGLVAATPFECGIVVLQYKPI